MPLQVAEEVCTEKKRHPAAPFTTSTLQQEANRKLGFSARKTMSTAQKLYEGIDIGDGSRRPDHLHANRLGRPCPTRPPGGPRGHLPGRYGKDYAPAKPRIFKSKARTPRKPMKRSAPPAYPGTPRHSSRFLDRDELRLYKLIWKRTVASQMTEALLDATTIDILAGDRYSSGRPGRSSASPAS